MFFRQSADHTHASDSFAKRAIPAAMIQVVLICLWVFLLRETSSYYSVYVLCAAAGILCTVKNTFDPSKGGLKQSKFLAGFAFWFAATTVLANYKLFIVKPALERIVSAGVAFAGGTVAGYHVMQFLAARIPFPLQRRDGKLSSAQFYLLSFCVLESIFLIYLLGAAYPAYFTPDAFSSMKQIAAGAYVNHNPFWYTISIKVIGGLGYNLFGSANAAMAFYVFCQGLTMSAVFSYVLVTFYQMGLPKWVITAAGAVYGLLPYNIAYSATVLKDIPFSISSLLFVVSLYRIIRKIGERQSLNYIFLTIGAFVFCLMRTNGLASFFITALIVLPLLQKSQKRILAILIAVIVSLGWILTNPVLKKWNVGSTDFVEGLAVPFQQIARVITMGYELDPYEYEMLNQVFDVELIPEVFMHQSVDPIKGPALREGARTVLRANTGEYIKLWLQMGKKYPGEYLKAWIELTKGYWNGGYKYWIYYLGGENPQFDISRPETMPLKGFFEGYFAFVESLAILQPLYSIGVHVWILFGCLVLNIRNKRAELVLMIPGIIIILGLWLGTPVYSEFRYAYPVILSIPLVLSTTFFFSEQN